MGKTVSFRLDPKMIEEIKGLVGEGRFSGFIKSAVKYYLNGFKATEKHREMLAALMAFAAGMQDGAEVELERYDMDPGELRRKYSECFKVKTANECVSEYDGRIVGYRLVIHKRYGYDFKASFHVVRPLAYLDGGLEMVLDSASVFDVVYDGELRVKGRVSDEHARIVLELLDAAPELLGRR